MSGIASGRVIFRGRLAFANAAREMEVFTASRNEDTVDELWWLEHEPVYTLGARGSRESFRHAGTIPVHATGRGGEITYHGPGQLVIYPLLDLHRMGWRTRDLVTALEDAVLAVAGPNGRRDPGGPGVFIGPRKLASIGMRVRRGRTSHGLAVNVTNDLAPFDDIDPCGRAGLRMTSLAHEGDDRSLPDIAPVVIDALVQRLGWNDVAGPLEVVA